MPSWNAASSPPAEPADRLILLPGCSKADLPDGWLAKTEASGAVVLTDLADRNRLLEAFFEKFEIEAEAIDLPLVADFLALGYCHLQVELLTRQLRYMSNLDEAQFERKTLAAAEEAARNNVESARDHLQSAFDLLTEAREYFYPVETYLLDLTLVAPTTMGQSLRADLSGGGKVNLLVSGSTVQQMAQREPASLAAIKEAFEKETVSLIGGEFDERELSLLPAEAILDQIARGLDAYTRHLGQRPKIFARRRFGLSPILPQILLKLGFVGAFHFTLDDGRFPRGNQSKIRWEGLGASTLDAMTRLPIDAAQSECFLSLPEKLGDAMDLDHASTAVFAHWPGQARRWYEDLRRAADYSPVLGRFTLVANYFRDTEYVGQSNRYQADQYRSPYLRQEVAAENPDPISRWVEYYRRRASADAIQRINTLAVLLGHLPGEETGENPSLSQATQRLAEALPRQDGEPHQGYLVVNPLSFTRRIDVDVSRLSQLPRTGGPVWTSAQTGDQKRAIVDVPPMGFVWLGDDLRAAAPPEAQHALSPNPPPKSPKKLGWWPSKRSGDEQAQDPPLADENVLRNDYFEVKLDPVTGAIRSIQDYAARGAMLAQQVALRQPASARPPEGWGGEDGESQYTVMAADEISVTSPGPIVGEIVTRGRLLDRRGTLMAGFRQTIRAERGSRILDLEIELDVQRQPGPDPWDSYYCSRFAWGDATADLVRGVHSISLPSETPQIEAPYFIEIRTEKKRMAILTGGLPYHRRFGLRRLDTLLVVGGERARSFRLGIGIGLKYPMAAALDYLSPATVWCENAPPPPARSAWLFHVSSRNVVTTHLEPLFADGRATGFRARLSETEGRSTRVTLRSFRPVASARTTDFLGEKPEEIAVSGDSLAVDVEAHGWVQIEAQFAG
jgi:alpha-mannosidase